MYDCYEKAIGQSSACVCVCVCVCVSGGWYLWYFIVQCVIIDSKFKVGLAHAAGSDAFNTNLTASCRVLTTPVLYFIFT